MNGANHLISGFSTYPFYIFGNGWESVYAAAGRFPLQGRHGHRERRVARIRCASNAGVKIGDGAIVAARLW